MGLWRAERSWRGGGGCGGSHAWVTVTRGVDGPVDEYVDRSVDR